MAQTRTCHSCRAGVTLVELMVMSVIASLVVLTVIQGFSGIAKGTLAGRFKSVATQMANEKVQSLKNVSYYRLFVSSQTVTPSGLGSLVPPVLSDEINYPPLGVSVNGVVFTTYVNVQRVLKTTADVFQTIAWNAPDSGLKQITADVVWKERGSIRRMRITNVYENSQKLVPNGQISGRVYSPPPLTLVPNVVVSLLEDPTVKTLTDGSGSFQLRCPVGTYTLQAYKRGYFNKWLSGITISEANPNFNNANIYFFTKKSTGSVSGAVWRNDHLVISRIGPSWRNPATPYCFVEIFNPTTWTWTVDGQMGLKSYTGAGAIAIVIDYSKGGNTIAPGGFYLFASTPTLVDSTVTVHADAVWDKTVGGANDVNFGVNFEPSSGNYRVVEPAEEPLMGEGGLVLYNTVNGTVIDKVGWTSPDGAVTLAGSYDVSPIPGFSNYWLYPDYFYYRKSSSSGVFSDTLGPAYDSGNNSLDWGVFLDSSINPNPPPRSTETPTPMPVQSGVPYADTLVWANDGLSQVSRASLVGSPPEARYTLSGVATGTWTVNASNGNYFGSYSTSVVSGANGSTNVLLTTTTLFGFVEGTVSEGGSLFPQPVLPNITIGPGSALTDSVGYYMMPILAGQQVLIIPNVDGSDLSHYQDFPTSTFLSPGTIQRYDISLLASGELKGRVTLDGVTGIPDIPVEFFDAFMGLEKKLASTDNNGYFSIMLSRGWGSGDFVVRPVSGNQDVFVPDSPTVNLTAGCSIFVATFTLTSPMGTLTGSVLKGGSLITSGAVVLVSTGTIPAQPPDIDNAFRTGGTYLYSGQSRTNGTYSIGIPGGTYNVAGYYTTFNGATPVINRRDYSNIIINPGQKTNLDLQW